MIMSEVPLYALAASATPGVTFLLSNKFNIVLGNRCVHTPPAVLTGLKLPRFQGLVLDLTLSFFDT